MPKIRVDGKEIETKQGTTLLQACLDNDIYIPNLCFLESMGNPLASCRMCFVEIQGERQPVTSCTVAVEDDMVVKTDTPAVRQLQRTALRLLLSVHHVDCKHCPANKKCELQRIGKFLQVGLKPKGLERYLKETEVDQNHPFLNHYPNRCVLCGKCVHICRREHGQSVWTLAERGFDTVISAYGEGEASSQACEKCDVCVKICPVGALTLKDAQEDS